MSFEFVLLLADIFTILFNSLFMIDVSNKVRKGNIYNKKKVNKENEIPASNSNNTRQIEIDWRSF